MVPAYSVNQPGGGVGPSYLLLSPQDGHSESRWGQVQAQVPLYGVAGKELPTVILGVVAAKTSDSTSCQVLYWAFLSCLNESSSSQDSVLAPQLCPALCAPQAISQSQNPAATSQDIHSGLFGCPLQQGPGRLTRIGVWGQREVPVPDQSCFCLCVAVSRGQLQGQTGT